MSDKAASRRLKLTADRTGKAPVVRCSGRLVAGETDRFYSDVKQLIPRCNRVVLDFKDLTHMDSSGIGALVRLYVSGKSAGCVIELIHIGPSVRQLLGVTHLLSVFQMIGEHNIRMG